MNNWQTGHARLGDNRAVLTPQFLRYNTARGKSKIYTHNAHQDNKSKIRHTSLN